MGIEAFLDVEKDKEIQELTELSPEGYKDIAADLAITKAEQSIIDEVVGVDGDLNDEDDDRQELEDEREMKTLFQQLYEIDPETKEVFVKGSAYDLKKWDEDMVCFTFGDPERVIALEAAISPGERYLAKCFNRLTSKHSALTNIIKKHSNDLRAKTISKSFAQDFKSVMGYGLPNIHMESFTVFPSQTNYSIAMEEMTNQQIAITAGAGLAGVAIVYKLIQWFARALNKNTLATGSISANFKAYNDRKEMMKNLPVDLEKAKANINAALDEFKVAVGDNPAMDINDALGHLSKAANASDGAVAFNEATLAYLSAELAGKITPFMERLISGELGTPWWDTLNKTIVEAKKAQSAIMARLEDGGKQFANDKTTETGQVKNTYAWVADTIFKLDLPKINNNPQNGASPTALPSVDDWSAVASWFTANTSNAFTPYTDKRKLVATEKSLDALTQINVELFNNLDSGHVDEMTKIADRLKQHASEAAKKGKEASKENKVEKGDRAKEIMELSKEFQFVSSILRFAIQIRNQLGQLSVKLTTASEKSTSMLKKLGMAISAAARAPGEALSKVKEGLNS